jgi:ParB family chromosome partitioning protein
MEQNIYIDTIHLDRALLRQELDKDYITQLAEDIRARGLLQAIVLRPREGGGWRLVAGRCRLEAAKQLAWTTIPARIIDEGDLDEIDGLQENLIRKQMNPLEEALAIKMLQETKNMSIREICEKLNRGTSWIQDRLSLLQMPEHFQKAVAQRKLTIGAAGQLLLITDIDYREYLLSIAICNGATVKQTEGWYLEWRARQQFTNPHGQDGPLPQLPPRPLKVLTPCAFCDEEAPIDETNLLRVCGPCCHDLYQAKLARQTAEHTEPEKEKLKS